MLTPAALAAWHCAEELLAELTRIKGRTRQRSSRIPALAQRAAMDLCTSIADAGGASMPSAGMVSAGAAIDRLGELAALVRAARNLNLLTETEWNRIEQLRGRCARLAWRLSEDLLERARARPPRPRTAGIDREALLARLASLPAAPAGDSDNHVGRFIKR